MDHQRPNPTWMSFSKRCYQIVNDFKTSTLKTLTAAERRAMKGAPSRSFMRKFLVASELSTSVSQTRVGPSTSTGLLGMPLEVEAEFPEYEKSFALTTTLRRGTQVRFVEHTSMPQPHSTSAMHTVCTSSRSSRRRVWGNADTAYAAAKKPRFRSHCGSPRLLHAACQ